MKLKDKVVILTGAAGGIGSAIALQMAREGARVVLSDLHEAPLHACVDRLRSDGHDVSGVCTDISTAAGNRKLIDHAIATFGRVDVFHANAGIARFEDLLQSTPDGISRTLEINLHGAIHGCAAVLPVMVQQRSGVILLTASVAAFVGDPTVPVYSASKGGLTALCKSIAVRHGPDGVRCVTICPGDVRTPMLETYLARDPEPDKSYREMIERYPLRRLAEPIDVARTAVFLASDDAAWITGTDIVIDGGLTARCY